MFPIQSTTDDSKLYSDDVFSTYLYTGNGSTQTINNGIDLAGKGGMTWIKERAGLGFSHQLKSSADGWVRALSSDSTAAGSGNDTQLVPSGSGFTLSASFIAANYNGSTFASYTFRKAPKFFDVVTYTGDGASSRQIPHNLKSKPGFVVVKRTDATGRWVVGARKTDVDWSSLCLNTNENETTAYNNNNGIVQYGTTTSTYFEVIDKGTGVADVNANGGTYVAYLFAHDAGADGLIQCGSFTTDASGNATVSSIGWEPQFALIKASYTTGDWLMLDSMRGWNLTANDAVLKANSSGAESTSTEYGNPTATGFEFKGGSANATYIYTVIRRPNKPPTSGTSVFGLNARTGTGANATVTGGAGVSDAVLIKNRGAAVGDLFAARLTGTGYLETSSYAAEVAAGTSILQANPWDVMDGVKVGTTSTITNASSNTYINYAFKRAPGFFDVVCYTGTTVERTVNHNLGVAPEFGIFMRRTTGGTSSLVYHSALTATKTIQLQQNGAAISYIAAFVNTAPTNSVVTLGTSSNINNRGDTYVAYLFATCPGVSKVGSYTGNGSTQTINCGFTGGARFVMIKRTDSTGDWYVWDSARGIVAANDPHLSLNTAAAEVTTDDSVDPDNSGFIVNQNTATNINVLNGQYVYLCVA